MTMASPEGIKVSSQNEDSYEADGATNNDKLEKIVERKKFEEVLTKIYFGTIDEQADIIFNM